jgi:hypothetical protein
MDITIRIGNKVVEGVKPSTVKLTINNVDPFMIGERTNAYSATVKVPRTEINDTIFASERFPMFYKKNNVYIAYVYFGGLASPFTDGQFVAQVKAEKDGYSISLVQNTVNPSNTSLPVSTKSVREGYEFDPVTNTFNQLKRVAMVKDTYFDAVNGRGQFMYPPIAAGYSPDEVEIGFDLEARDVTHKEIEGLWSECAYMGASNTINGGAYPNSYFRPTNAFVDSVMGRYNQASSRIYATVDVGSYVLLDVDVPRIMLRAYQLTTDEMNIVLDRTDLLPNGAVKYEVKVKQDFIYIVSNRGTKFLDFYFHNTDLVPPNDTVNYRPTKSVPVEDAMHVAVCIWFIEQFDGHQVMPVDMPYGAMDLIKGMCQMFAWRYTFDHTVPSFTAKQIIKGHPNTYESKEYVDWSGREDATTAQYSEVSGLGSEMVVKVGEFEYVVGGNHNNVTRRTNAFSSSLAFKKKKYDGTPRVFDVIHTNTGGAGWVEGDYMRHPKGYTKYLNDYFLPFQNSYQVTVDANLSYFDIANFKDDALYRFANLGGSFYLRKIENWDASTGKCKLTLISVDL